MLKPFAEWLATELTLVIGDTLDAGAYNPHEGPVFRSVITEPPGGHVDTLRPANQAAPLQIFTRAAELHQAREEAERIHRFLAGKIGIQLTGWYIYSIAALGRPSTLGTDEQGRPLYTCTYMVRVKRET